MAACVFSCRFNLPEVKETVVSEPSFFCLFDGLAFAEFCSAEAATAVTAAFAALHTLHTLHTVHAMHTMHTMQTLHTRHT